VVARDPEGADEEAILDCRGYQKTGIPTHMRVEGLRKYFVWLLAIKRKDGGAER
jgi:hypothetical protein